MGELRIPCWYREECWNGNEKPMIGRSLMILVHQRKAGSSLCLGGFRFTFDDLGRIVHDIEVSRTLSC